MAERRMFSKTIVDSDDFLDMPAEAQLLYFHLSMRADDDGFITPKKVMRLIGAKDDSIKLLIAKNFIIPFDTGVIVIRHWRINNYLRNDRYKETEYVDEKKQLDLVNNKYEKNDADINGIPVVYQRDTQVRLGKDSIGKNNDNSLRSLSCSEPYSERTEIHPDKCEENNIYLSFPTKFQKPNKTKMDDPVMFDITYEDVERYKKAFPDIDVESCIRESCDWCWFHKSRRKSDIKKFIYNWLSNPISQNNKTKDDKPDLPNGLYQIRRDK